MEEMDHEMKSQKEEVDGMEDEQIDRGEIMEILLNTREQGQMMEQLIKNQIQVKDDMIGKLHNELEFYRQGSADRFVDQLMKALIKVRKDMKRIMSADKWEDMSADELRQQYLYTFQDLTDMLEQQNVDEYSTGEGEYFDAAIHQAKIEVTTDPDLDKKVKESLAEGYRKGEKILQPERVVVYQYKNGGES